MKKFKLPFALPSGVIPVVTQFYGDSSRAQWYKDHGLNMPSHNGIDFVIKRIDEEDPFITYGTKLVCPFPAADLSMTWFTDPMSTTGNGIQIGFDIGADRYNLILWHCSEIVVKPSYKEGDTVGYVGNSGLVDPPPTLAKPFAGAHLHMGLRKNNVLIDPLELFDLTQWFTSTGDTPQEKDLPPFFWVVAAIKKQVDALMKKYGK